MYVSLLKKKVINNVKNIGKALKKKVRLQNKGQKDI